jgi:hypothetical protein
MVLWPFHHFMIVGAAASVLRSASVADAALCVPRWSAGLAYAAMGLVIALQLATTGVSVAAGAVSRQFDQNWDPAIYELSRRLNEMQREARTIVFTDWGMGTQIMALASPERRSGIRDLWQGLNELHTQSAESRRWYGQQLNGPGVLIVTHSENRMVMPTTRINLFELDREQALHLERVAVINGADGAPLFEIYRPRTLVR